VDVNPVAQFGFLVQDFCFVSFCFVITAKEKERSHIKRQPDITIYSMATISVGRAKETIKPRNYSERVQLQTLKTHPSMAACG
jgi:hypothetical protein